MAYKLSVEFTNGDSEELDGVFSTKEEAMDAFNSYCMDYSAGAAMSAEMAHEEGDLYDDPDIEGYSMEKI